MLKVKFENNKALFYAELKSRIDRYFEQNKIQKTGNFQLYLKTIVLSTVFILNYVILVFFTPATLPALLLCALMGMTFSAIGFNMMHDGAHGTYSKNKTVNVIMAHTLNLLGGNAYLWNQKHNINHHTFTNVEGLDDDIDLKPFIRVHDDQKKLKMHRYQHIYVPFLYGLTLLFWVFYRDFKKYFSGTIAENTSMKKMKLNDHVIFWAFKIIHIGLFLVIPMVLIGFWQTILGYITMSVTAGFVLAVVFQLAHIVEDTGFEAPKDNLVHIQSEWAVHQVRTTANFATGNKVLSWLLGGLNYQVEHHLFPNISHIHYPQINRFVKEVCEDFNVQYIEYPTMWLAFRSHLAHIKRIGSAS